MRECLVAVYPDRLPRGPRAGLLFIPDKTIALLSGFDPCFEAVARYVKEVAAP